MGTSYNWYKYCTEQELTDFFDSQEILLESNIDDPMWGPTDFELEFEIPNCKG